MDAQTLNLIVQIINANAAVSLGRDDSLVHELRDHLAQHGYLRRINHPHIGMVEAISGQYPIGPRKERYVGSTEEEWEAFCKRPDTFVFTCAVLDSVDTEALHQALNSFGLGLVKIDVGGSSDQYFRIEEGET